MFKKAVQQGRCEVCEATNKSLTFADGGELVRAQCLRGEAFSVPYVEPLSDARTKLSDFFNILLVINRCSY